MVRENRFEAFLQSSASPAVTVTSEKYFGSVKHIEALINVNVNDSDVNV